jgi:hypothetical protein
MMTTLVAQLHVWFVIIADEVFEGAAPPIRARRPLRRQPQAVVHTCRKQQRHVLNSLVDAVQAAFNHRAAPSLLARAP